MASIKDEEDLIKSVRDYVKNNLNAKITAINTEKGDFDIDSITADNDHYVIGGALLDLPNHIFVNTAVREEISTQNVHNDIAGTIAIVVEVAFSDMKDDKDYYRSLRYMRAVYETLLNYESSVDVAGGVEITKAVPMLVVANRTQLIISGASMTLAFS